MISYLKHDEINREKWDDCIGNAVNMLPYAFCWWLDKVSPLWEALVLDDYVAVMPLTRGKKAGIEYLFQPYFTQQLGVISRVPVDTDEFLRSIPVNYRYVDIQLNTENTPAENSFRIIRRNNYMLDLAPGYANLMSAYHRNCRRNIQKAIRAGLEVSKGPGPSAFSWFVKQQLEKRILPGSRKLFTLLSGLVMASIEHANAEILGVYNKSGDLLAAGWILYAPARCFFLVCASSPAGKDSEAMYLLVDHVIRKKAGTNMWFDFTGSNAKGIAYFNAGFGAINHPYPAIKRNRLPWPLSVIKK